MIRTLTEREQNILAVAMTMAVLAVFYNGVVGSLLEKKEILVQEIKQLQAQWVQEKTIIARSRTINAKFNAYWEQFNRPGTKEETESEVLSEIEGVARKLGLQVTNLKPGWTLKDGYDDQFSVSLTINSEFLKTIRFLYELQQEPYFFNVEGLEVEKSTRDDTSIITSRFVLTKAFISSYEKEKHEQNIQR